MGSSKKNTKIGNGSKNAAPAHKSPAKAPEKKGISKPALIAAGIVVVAVVGFMMAAGSGGSKQGGTLTPTPEEAKYIGRFLPQGYIEPKVTEGGAVTADIPMAPIQIEQSDAGLTIPLAEVVSKRNVGFNYTKADGTPIALIAYVKPSGKLVVAVSFCVPCKGTSHTMTTDSAMTCDACGTKRDIETAVGISGPCKLYPMDEMPVTVDGDTITIQKDILENWIEQPTDRKVG